MYLVYLNVIGSCTPDSLCTNDLTCSPCNNIYNTQYSVVVSDNANPNYSSNLNTYLGPCPSDPSITPTPVTASGVSQLFTTLVLDGALSSTYLSLCDQYTYFQVYISNPCLDLNILGSHHT